MTEIPKKAPKATAPADKNPLETASSIMTDLARTNFEESVETVKAVMASKDLKSAFELQNELFRATLKRNMDAAREINELTVSAMKEAMGPLTEKFTEAFDKMKAA
ncbi:MAG: phasin family protein [Parvibaculum sp.]